MKRLPVLVIAILALLIVRANAATSHTFTLDVAQWNDKPKTVNVAGDFNGWSKDAAPLHRNGMLWTANVNLEDGIHQYKFVIDGERWISDPKSDPAFDVDDTFGGHNSGVLIGPDARKLPPPLPNAINTEGILFKDNDVTDRNVVSDSQLRLRIRVQANDVQHVYVRCGNYSNRDWPKQELHKLETILGFDLYGGTINVPPECVGKQLNYGFELVDGAADVLWATGKTYPTLEKLIPWTEAVMMIPNFITPDWAEHAVWYQIFPERFRNGDTANDPANDEENHFVRWTSRWFSAQPGEAPGEENFYEGQGNVWKRRYGGDIQGIRQALPYLRKLGVNAIYLNPVFEAASMHKYDTTDYRHIDNHFGVKGDWPVTGETDDPATWKWSASDKVFLDFLADAHKQGFKVIVDGVFNHVGRPNPFFQDVLEHGKNSKYAGWFEITDWGNPKNWHKMEDPYTVHGKPGGIQWKAWDGPNGHLPAFKKSNETGLAHGPYEHIMAITKRWLAPDGDPARGIDGFRLDAANEVPHPFWRDWRKVVKSTKPDAYISGEIWSPARPWINDGKQFDAVMNYQFAMPTLQFFANNRQPLSPSEYARRMTNLIYLYPEQASRVMMNLFDSHDTDRLASMFVNPDRSYDAGNRMQEPEAKNYNPRKPTPLETRRMLQAVGMQMTFLGAPMIYYGDEAGMWSADDPSDRQPMTWPGMKFDDPEVGFNPKTFARYQQLIAIRRALPALESGDFYPVATDDAQGTLVFARRTPRQTVYIALNRGDSSKTISFPVPETDAGRSFINYADPGSIEMMEPTNGDGRTTVKPKVEAKTIEANNATLTVTIGAYEDAILARKP